MGFRDGFKRERQTENRIVHNEDDVDSALSQLNAALERVEADDGRQKLRLTMQLDFVATEEATERVKEYSDQIRQVMEVTSRSVAEAITKISQDDAIGAAQVELKTDSMSDDEMQQFREHLQRNYEANNE
jgi:hypothetical protein